MLNPVTSPKIEPEAEKTEKKSQSAISKMRGYDVKPHEALKTLVEADAIKSDPEMMGHVAKLAKSTVKTHKRIIRSVKDLKDARDDMANGGESKETMPDGDE